MTSIDTNKVKNNIPLSTLLISAKESLCAFAALNKPSAIFLFRKSNKVSIIANLSLKKIGKTHEPGHLSKRNLFSQNISSKSFDQIFSFSCKTDSLEIYG
jgi:hypothetical protein